MNDSLGVLAHLKSEQQAMTDLLKDLVNMETPSTDRDSQEPIKARLKSEFESLDFRVCSIPGRETGGHIYARPLDRARDRPVQLMD